MRSSDERSTDTRGAISIRTATPADRPAILDVCRVSLGWQPGDPNEAFFAWKHDENVFGPSPTWVALNGDGAVVGVRCFLRWTFRDPDGTLVRAVRAVDTATHPDARGLGVFRRLTLGALTDLEADEIGFVFNTPNEQSRPGYLKMGWSTVGRVPLGVQPARLRPRRSSVTWSGADKWGVPTGAGLSPAEAFADTDAVGHLLAGLPQPPGLHTDRSVEYLRWRYGFEPLAYRVLPVGDTLAGGALVFRLRRRGSRLDATVCEELLPRRRLLEPAYRRLARETGADLILRTQGAAVGPGPFVRVRRLGPLLTWRPLARPGVPQLTELDLTYGDLELF